MRRSRLCSTKICESNRKCNVLIKDDGSDGVWEAQTIDFILDEDDDGIMERNEFFKCNI